MFSFTKASSCRLSLHQSPCLVQESTQDGPNTVTYGVSFHPHNSLPAAGQHPAVRRQRNAGLEPAAHQPWRRCQQPNIPETASSRGSRSINTEVTLRAANDTATTQNIHFFFKDRLWC